MHPQPEELALIARASAGDRAALGELYQRYVAEIYRYMLYRTGEPMAAEDVTAEVFASMITSIARYEPRGVPFRAWLFRIARARLADHWRSYERHAGRQVLLSEALASVLAGDAPEYHDYTPLVQALAYLTELEREVVLLRFAGGLSNEEIAGVVGSNVNAVKGRLHRALKKLRRILENRAAQDEE